MSLSDELAAAEHAYRTAVMALVKRADDVEPLAYMAEHLANMTATVRAATLAAMERVDLFDSMAATGRAAEYAVQPDADRPEAPRDDLGQAGMHLDHVVHLLEAGETMAGHATFHLLRAAHPDDPTVGGST